MSLLALFAANTYPIFFILYYSIMYWADLRGVPRIYHKYWQPRTM